MVYWKVVILALLVRAILQASSVPIVPKKMISRNYRRAILNKFPQMWVVKQIKMKILILHRFLPTLIQKYKNKTVVAKLKWDGQMSQYKKLASYF